MFKSQVPVCFCSLALIMVPPPSAHSGQSAAELQKNVLYPTNGTKPHPSKRRTFAISQPDKQGMKFVKHYIKNNDEDLLVVRKRSQGPFAIIDSVLDHY